jgi:16S rRNA (guanine527-N7)-methyltransferase
VADLLDRLIQRLALKGVPPPRPELLELHGRYIAVLAKWNRTINLTALPLDPLSDEAIDRLLVEPISASRLVGASVPGLSIVDIGSGGGSPAIPFWIELPGSRVTMIESRSRKCAFLREAVRQIKPGFGRAIESRFETLLAQSPDLDGSADLVTVRAVRLDSFTNGLIGQLLRPDGRVVHFAEQIQVIARSTWNKRDKELGSS